MRQEEIMRDKLFINSLYLPLNNFVRPSRNGGLRISWYLYPSLTEDIYYTNKLKNREVAWERKIERTCSYPYYYK